MISPYLIGEHVSHGGLDEAGQDDIHPNTELSELLRGRLTEPDDAGLAGGVVSVGHQPSPGHNAGDVDDGTRQLILLHQTRSRLQ